MLSHCCGAYLKITNIQMTTTSINSLLVTALKKEDGEIAAQQIRILA
jgi:hypothetical protein